MFKTMWGVTETKYNKRRSTANSRGNLEDSSQALRFADASSTVIITDSAGKSNRRSIGASEDAEYIEAVNRGDMTTAQRMVDEAAKAAGYDVRCC